jgi:ATP-dependent DNA helicase RecQ
MLRYFGEEAPAPCGHCSYCETGRATALPELPAPAPLEGAVDWGALRELAAAHRGALGEPRQQARFLCGLSSPALSRGKLSRHPLSGALAGRRFAEVLAFCAAV